MRRFIAIEGGACRSLVPCASAAPVPSIEKSYEEQAVDLRLRPIAAAKGRADLWPARRAIVVRHRGASGIAMSLTVPLQHYNGVSVDLDLSTDGHVRRARVVLSHADKGLEVELFNATDDRDVIAEWRRWARDLGLPMLMRTADGEQKIATALGVRGVAKAIPRRVPRASLKRRSLMSRRRQ